MTGISLSKLDCARRELETAIKLYFNWGDPVSIHTLAAAARQILADLCRQRGVKPLMSLDSMIDERVKPEYREEVRKTFRGPENFFKHADRDPDGTLDFNPEASEYWLFESVTTYRALCQEQVPAFVAYEGWWMLRNRELLLDPPQELLSSMSSMKFGADQRTEYFAGAMAAIAQIPP